MRSKGKLDREFAELSKLVQPQQLDNLRTPSAKRAKPLALVSGSRSSYITPADFQPFLFKTPTQEEIAEDIIKDLTQLQASSPETNEYPFYILLGENHDIPPDQVAEILIAHFVKQGKSVHCAFELPHEIWGPAIKNLKESKSTIFQDEILERVSVSKFISSQKENAFLKGICSTLSSKIGYSLSSQQLEFLSSQNRQVINSHYLGATVDAIDSVDIYENNPTGRDEFMTNMISKLGKGHDICIARVGSFHAQTIPTFYYEAKDTTFALDLKGPLGRRLCNLAGKNKVFSSAFIRQPHNSPLVQYGVSYESFDKVFPIESVY